MTYSITEWISFFFIYCFFGWCFECTLCSIEAKRFINRGFLRGPYIPIYGFGAITMIFAAIPVMGNPTLVFLCGALAATLLEYVTGTLMEVIFKTRYWDYSDCHYQISGRICAEATLMWGFLTLFVNYNVHTHIVSLIKHINVTILTAADIVLCILFIADLIISFKSAVDVASVSKRLYEIKTEATALIEKLSDKNTASDRIINIRKKLDKLQAERNSISEKIGIFQKSFIKSHPKAHMSKLNYTFKELYERTRNKADKK